MTTRRGFLAGLLAAGSAARAGWASVGEPACLAAARGRDGRFALFGLDADGAALFSVPLPSRGHAGAAHPRRAEAVAFARRPGDFALVLDCARGRVLRRLRPPEDAQFNGHGAYSADGALLYTSEQARETSAGQIGIWDVAAGYARIGARTTGGIGPHDLRLMPEGGGLVVANGGIATDPAGRGKLNIEQMRPNLTYLGPDGAIVEQLELDAGLRQNSIRHLSVRGDGLVGFAMQWEGAADGAPPLLGLHRRGAAPVLAEAPLADEIAMRGYAGSVAFGAAGGEIAITSPRGGRMHRFSDAGAFLGAVTRPDICGLASREGGYLASDGLGGMLAISGDGARVLARHDCAWDNHIVAL